MAGKEVMLTKQELFGIKLKTETVSLKTTGSEITVQQLSQRAANNIRKSCTNKSGVLIEDKFQTEMVMHGLIEPKLDKEDTDALDDIPASVFSEIGQAVLRINGYLETEEPKKD